MTVFAVDQPSIAGPVTAAVAPKRSSTGRATLQFQGPSGERRWPAITSYPASQSAKAGVPERVSLQFALFSKHCHTEGSWTVRLRF